ncbi:MAG TPA: phosphopentomutase [Bacillota bacterium]|nr:phosphopentomutase [Bacillota bacterium]
MQTFKRIFLIVLDSVGIGEAPDAHMYGDIGAHTLKHISEQMNGLNVPHLEKFGLGNLDDSIVGVQAKERPVAIHTKMIEKSIGKDTMTGHWELMGLHIKQPFQTFPDGFPAELIKQLESETNRQVIGNKVASGTVIIDELGKEHMEHGGLIVYTSADSVLQIAAHEDIVPVDELYNICEIARKLTLQEEFMVGRVIARPFVGTEGNFSRTKNRKDYALKPFGKTVLDELKQASYDVISLGKIADIFDNEGITKAIRTDDNDDGMKHLMRMIDEPFHGLCFLNLVDFDAKYGHRRDPIGYGKALEAFDKQLGSVINRLTDEDLLLITADHGNDPTFKGTDHTRELVPLFVFYHHLDEGKMLNDRESFADVGATIAENFKVTAPKIGKSFLKYL